MPGKMEETAVKFKRAGIFTKIIIVALLVYAVVSIISLRGRIDEAEATRASLEQQVEDQMAENESMKYDIKNSGDEDVVEDIAREKLGLVRPDEKVFYGN